MYSKYSKIIEKQKSRQLSLLFCFIRVLGVEF